MGLDLYMVGVVVEDMPRAVEFYRRLGVAVSEGAESQEHVEIPMGEMTFFLTTTAANARWDPLDRLRRAATASSSSSTSSQRTL